VGIIDNGSYLKFADSLESSDFRFDWMDISIDGPEEIHNRQRNSRGSFAQALAGIKNAQRMLLPGGAAHSLFTLTRINYASILDTCSILPANVKKWHITTLTPARPEIENLAVTEDEFLVSWEQICRANMIRPVVFRMYVAEDLLKLAKAVGKPQFLAAFNEAQVDLASISFILNEVQVVYYPQSVSTSETFVVDADACYHVPYSIAYTLDELNSGVSRYEENLDKYVIGKVDKHSSFLQLYQKCVDQWQREFSWEALQKEISIFKQIRDL
jgi:MoaA/NifB/PqqE/SkfB family radical SAM enzyme